MHAPVFHVHFLWCQSQQLATIWQTIGGHIIVVLSFVGSSEVVVVVVRV